MNPSKTQRLDYTILLCILIIAALARFVKLDASLWYDEIFTVANYVRLSVTDLLLTHSSFNNHPFYSLQAQLSVLLFGESNWAIRLPAALFGIASIAAMWQLVRPVVGSLQAHICALLIALSYHHVWFSQNARGYTELMFWCIASTVILINCLRNPTWKGWAVYGLIVAVGIYTHLTASIFFLAQGLLVAIIVFAKKGPYPLLHTTTGKEKWLMPLVGFVIGGGLTLLFYAPSIAHLFESVLSVSSTSSVDVMKEYQSPLWAALEILSSIALKPNLLTLLAAVTAIVLTCIGIFSVFKKEPLIPALFILHIVLLLTILLTLSMRIWPRFFFMDMGFVLFFMTHGVFVCCQQLTHILEKYSSFKLKAKNLFLLSSVLMIAISFVLLLRNYQIPKQNFEGSISYINKNALDTDKTVTLGLAAVPYNDYYQTGWQEIKTTEELKQIEVNAANTRLVIIFPSRTMRKYDNIMNHVDKNYSLARTFYGTLGDGAILIYLRNKKD